MSMTDVTNAATGRRRQRYHPLRTLCKLIDPVTPREEKDALIPTLRAQHHVVNDKFQRNDLAKFLREWVRDDVTAVRFCSMDALLTAVLLPVYQTVNEYQPSKVFRESCVSAYISPLLSCSPFIPTDIDWIFSRPLSIGSINVNGFTVGMFHESPIVRDKRFDHSQFDVFGYFHRVFGTLRGAPKMRELRIHSLPCATVAESEEISSLDEPHTGIKRAQRLEVLRINQCSLNPLIGAKIANFLWHAPSLRVLDVEGNKMNTVTCEAFIRALRFTPLLQELEIGVNDVGERGCIALRDVLPKIPSLKVLGLLLTGINEKGCLELASSLRRAPQIELIDVEANSIGDRGAHALAVALRSLPNLKSLWVGRPDMDSTGLLELQNAVARTYPSGSCVLKISALRYRL